METLPWTVGLHGLEAAGQDGLQPTRDGTGERWHGWRRRRGLKVPEILCVAKVGLILGHKAHGIHGAWDWAHWRSQTSRRRPTMFGLFLLEGIDHCSDASVLCRITLEGRARLVNLIVLLAGGKRVKHGTLHLVALAPGGSARAAATNRWHRVGDGREFRQFTQCTIRWGVIRTLSWVSKVMLGFASSASLSEASSTLTSSPRSIAMVCGSGAVEEQESQAEQTQQQLLAVQPMLGLPFNLAAVVHLLGLAQGARLPRGEKVASSGFAGHAKCVDINDQAAAGSGQGGASNRVLAERGALRRALLHTLPIALPLGIHKVGAGGKISSARIVSVSLP